MIAATAALEWAWRHWRVIATGAGFGFLGILLLTTRHTLANRTRERDSIQAAFEREQLAHSVTRASLATSLASIEDQNRAVQTLSDESQARTKSSEQARIAAQDAARASLSVAKALEASAAVVRPDAVKCAPSDAFWANRKDL